MLIWTWCRFVIFSLRLNCYSYNFTGKTESVFFIFTWESCIFFRKAVTFHGTIQWTRIVACQCSAISLHLTIYLMDFQQFQRIIFNFFKKKTTKKVKRTRAVTHHFIHLPQFFVSMCLILCSYIRFEMDFNRWGKLKVKIEFREKKNQFSWNWREWSY